MGIPTGSYVRIVSGPHAGSQGVVEGVDDRPGLAYRVMFENPAPEGPLAAWIPAEELEPVVEYAVQTRTFANGPFDRIETDYGWRHKFTRVEAFHVAARLNRQPFLQQLDAEHRIAARVVSRVVSPWKEES